MLASTSTVVGVINAALAGVIGGLVARSAGAGFRLSLLVGAAVTSMVGVLLIYAERRITERGVAWSTPASHDRSRSLSVRWA